MHNAWAVLVSELQAREDVVESLGSVRDALREQVERLRAEIARLAAERAEAEWPHDAAVRRSKELAPALAGLHDERGLHRPECGRTASASRVPAVEITIAKARTEEGWADHPPAERFPAAVTFSADGEPAAWSECPPKLEAPTSSPIPGPGVEAETSERTFPRESDLALVGAQLEMLDQLLRTGPSTGHVLIDQRRLTEFVLMIRKARRLASSLARVVEQTRRRDEIEYHRYLIRRAGEIKKTS